MRPVYGTFLGRSNVRRRDRGAPRSVAGRPLCLETAPAPGAAASMHNEPANLGRPGSPTRHCSTDGLSSFDKFAKKEKRRTGLLPGKLAVSRGIIRSRSDPMRYLTCLVVCLCFC